MKTLVCEIPEETGYVIPISDLHLGDKSFTKNSLAVLKGNLNWVKEHPNTRIVLVGDIFNCATRESKTEPFNQETGEFEKAIEIFKPYASQIVTAIDGNHEHRIEDFANHSVMNAFCIALGIPYSHISCVVQFRVNKRPDDKRFVHNYVGYFHHSTGGGKTMGSKLNRVEVMTTLLTNADFYVGAHHHGLMSSSIISREYNVRTNKVEDHRQYLVGAGGYLEWDESYAERGMLRPLKIGSPRIRLDGTKEHKDVHVNL
jgi:hypothetical protein